jgi:hypothetical protein
MWVGALQERQAPWQATLQQTPSAQKPEMQSLGPWGQGAPMGRLPQLLAAQAWPVEHIAELLQSS